MLTRKCIYMESCSFKDDKECVDNLFGCLNTKMSNKEEAENPKKSRQ